MSPQNIYFLPICPISSIGVAITNYVNSLASSFKRFYDAGSLIQHYVYSSFGKVLEIVDNSGNEITANPINGYTIRELDTESGLMFYRARYYMPEIGRFIENDPHPQVDMDAKLNISKHDFCNIEKN